MSKPDSRRKTPRRFTLYELKMRRLARKLEKRAVSEAIQRARELR